ncbi:hypothetical protein [Enterococcus gilvus]|uniref:hypothetical protein n=1 Tax=Enterococcus gilvus TaxID=160453 RepID=UPI003EDAD384
MNRFVLLTKNTLCEQPFQQQMQQLNYELFPSLTLVESLLKDTLDQQHLPLFSAVSISETILTHDRNGGLSMVEKSQREEKKKGIFNAVRCLAKKRGG